MGDTTKIAWCDHTFNPWVGCQKVSPGCANCYAESYDKRVGGGVNLDGVKRLRWGVGAERVRTSRANWAKPVRWNRDAEKAGVRRRVFCSSLADVFDAEVDRAWKADLWALIATTPNLDWLLLTKRAERITEELRNAQINLHSKCVPSHLYTGDAWPLLNVWLGVTVENQAEADRRIPLLLAQDAEVRFLSMEPLLGPVDLTRWLEVWGASDATGKTTCTGLDWVIIGGESGGKARAFDVAWARSLVRQCRAAGVAAFVKQMGSRPENSEAMGGPVELKLDDHHGGDPAEWPEDLQIREFPEVAP